MQHNYSIMLCIMVCAILEVKNDTEYLRAQQGTLLIERH